MSKSKEGKTTDLVELGEEFKGYSPLPTKTQTIADFEEEELSKRTLPDGSKLTWNKFITTRYYKDNLTKFSLIPERDGEQ